MQSGWRFSFPKSCVNSCFETILRIPTLSYLLYSIYFHVSIFSSNLLNINGLWVVVQLCFLFWRRYRFGMVHALPYIRYKCADRRKVKKESGESTQLKLDSLHRYRNRPRV